MLEQGDEEEPPVARELNSTVVQDRPIAWSTSESLGLDKDAATFDMPLAQLLQELDERNIRYSADATRSELVHLLRNSILSPQDQNISTSELTAELNRGSIQSNTGESPPILTFRNSPVNASLPSKHDVSLEHLLEELDHRNIRYPPTANRAELEALLQLDNRSSAKTADDPPKRRMSLRTLLKELDQRGVRFPPTATRKDLEELLEQDRKQPVRQSLSEAEQRRRRRLERQSKHRKEGNKAPLQSILWKSTEIATKRVKKLPGQVLKITSNSQLPNRLSKVAERTARRARRMTRRVADFWGNDDDEGIREPDWYYVSTDTPIDVPATPVEEDDYRRSTRPPVDVPRKRRRRPTRDDGVWNERRRRPSSPPRPLPSRLNAPYIGSVFQLPPTSEDTVLFPSLQNNDDIDEGENKPRVRFQETTKPISGQKSAKKSVKRSPSRRPERKSRPEQGRSNKKIYSIYKHDDDDEQNLDAFDKFGNLIANAADQILWGDENDGDSVDDGDEDRRSTASVGKNAKRPPKPRYWKDRLAEQLDYALGIHEDGKYYNSWEKQMAEERKDGKGRQRSSDDTVRQGRRAESAQKRRNYPDTPFWEQEGNLVSLLFGRTRNGGKLSIERYLEANGRQNHLTTFFKSALNASLLLASYTCRWASVRGAVPQPVVVIGVTAAALCARPKRRISTILMTLVVIRTLGELIHAYVYGDDAWEEHDGDSYRSDASVESDPTTSSANDGCWDDIDR